MANIQKVIINKHYYIIKVVCNNGRLVYYKIGEGQTIGRPTKLIEKYRKLRANEAVLLTFEELPHNDKKRLNDKLIHAKLDPNILKPADPIYIEHYLGETDGSNEFFEPVKQMTDDEVVEYVKQVVASIKKTEYKARNIENSTLQYGKDEYHLVNTVFLDAIFKAAPEVYNAIFNNTNSNILLIGQFEFDFIAAIAMYNNVYIWHDAEENKHKFTFEKLNERIHYIDNLKELLEMEISFKSVLENCPYGSQGAIINNIVRSDVDWENCVSLLPIKDMPDAGLEACSYIDMTRLKPLPPHTFPDADILTHILIFTKKKNKEYNSFKEVCADSFNIDKPMIKFMRANELKYHYAFDNIKMWTKDVDVKKSFIYQLLRTQSQHTCGMDLLETASVANEYNFNNNVITEKTPLIKNTIITVAGNSNYKTAIFNTEIEKQRLVHIYKLARNFINRMITNQFLGIRDDGACWPKVDLTDDKWDSMTTEVEVITAIMKEVSNSSDEEIKAVLDTMNVDYAIKNDDDINRLFGEYINEIK